MDTLPADVRVGPCRHTQLTVTVVAPGVDETVDRYAEGVEGAAADVGDVGDDCLDDLSNTLATH